MNRRDRQIVQAAIESIENELMNRLHGKVSLDKTYGTLERPAEYRLRYWLTEKECPLCDIPSICQMLFMALPALALEELSAPGAL